MHNHNVVLMLPGGIAKPSGKIVSVPHVANEDGSACTQTRMRWHFHVHAQSGWRLVASNAWGIQEDILQHCEECGVEMLHIYVKAEDATYSIRPDELRTYAVDGYHRLWNRMKNVSEHHFTRTGGKVPAGKVWVPDEVAEVISARGSGDRAEAQPVLQTSLDRPVENSLEL